MREPPTTSILATPLEIYAARDRAVKQVEELLARLHERVNEAEYTWQGVAETEICVTFLEQIVEALQ